MSVLLVIFVRLLLRSPVSVLPLLCEVLLFSLLLYETAFGCFPSCSPMRLSLRISHLDMLLSTYFAILFIFIYFHLCFVKLSLYFYLFIYLCIIFLKPLFPEVYLLAFTVIFVLRLFFKYDYAFSLLYIFKSLLFSINFQRHLSGPFLFILHSYL